MKSTNKILSVILVLAILMSGIVITTLSTNASTGDIKVWSPFWPNVPGDVNGRVTPNPDGTITVKSTTHDFFTWGLRVDSTVPQGTYYLKYTYKADGIGSQEGNEGQNEFGYWDNFNGQSGRFGPSQDGEWVSKVHQIDVSAGGLPSEGANSELRFKNMWFGGDFSITFGPEIVLSTDNTPLPLPADKDALNTAISEAEALYNGATEGTSSGNYRPGSKAIFKEAIDAAKAVANDFYAAQQDIDDAVAALGTAKSAFDAEKVVKVWNSFWPNREGDVNGRVTPNPDGTVTVKSTTHDFFIWGLYLDSAIPQGTYYLKYTYKADGVGSQAGNEGQNEFGYWDNFNGANARFGPSQDGEWVSVVNQINVGAGGLGTNSELRFKNMWHGGGFSITFGPEIVLSTNNTPLPLPGNKGALNTAISEAETLYNGAAEGTSSGNYRPGSKAIFKEAIDEAKAVANDFYAAQQDIDDAVAALSTAKSAFDAEKVIKVWSSFWPNREGDVNGRITLNADGTVTTNYDTHDFFIWGLYLDSALPQGTYYLKYTYKADGVGLQDGNEGQNEFGYWDNFNGANARFGPSADGQWVSVVNQINVGAGGLGTNSELRFKNMWFGGDFSITFGPDIVLSTNNTPLPVPTTDKTELNAFIAFSEMLHDEATEGTSWGDFEVGSKAIFKAAIDAARAVASDFNATQEEIDNAVETLYEAFEAFLDAMIMDGDIDITELDILIVLAETLYEGSTEGTSLGDFQVGSKAILRAAIDAAIAVAEDEDATQEEIESAVEALTAAMETFLESIVAEEDEDADKTALNKAITDAEELYNKAVEGTAAGNYKVGSKAKLKAAIDAAKAVANKQDATQDEVDEALAALKVGTTAFEAAKIVKGENPKTSDVNAIPYVVSILLATLVLGAIVMRKKFANQ